MSDNDQHSAPSDLHTVTIEHDAGATTLAFGYQAQADVAYSDVPKASRWFATEAEAEQYGARIVGVGNWRSFTVEKRYFAEGAPRG